MKTAISVPDPVFEAGERLAQRLGVSRSYLYSVALRDYLRQHDDAEITRRLNEVYDREPSEPDPVLLKIASRALPRESWK
jgi:metal-responsive CopG/Arc/MetJ family transcriptional regulator